MVSCFISELHALIGCLKLRADVRMFTELNIVVALCVPFLSRSNLFLNHALVSCFGILLITRSYS
jgi:hypothetical protein